MTSAVARDRLDSVRCPCKKPGPTPLVSVCFRACRAEPGSNSEWTGAPRSRPSRLFTGAPTTPTRLERNYVRSASGCTPRTQIWTFPVPPHTPHRTLSVPTTVVALCRKFLVRGVYGAQNKTGALPVFVHPWVDAIVLIARSILSQSFRFCFSQDPFCKRGDGRG